MVLNFDDELGKRHFEFCFAGFVLGGCVQERKGVTILRREIGLLDKLESISEVKPCGKKLVSGEPDRQLKAEGPKQINIDMQEYDLLLAYMGQVPWQSGSPARYAVEAIDWLERSSRGNS